MDSILKLKFEIQKDKLSISVWIEIHKLSLGFQLEKIINTAECHTAKPCTIYLMGQ